VSDDRRDNRREGELSMGSCWIRLPDADGAGGYDFENEDYGVAGPPDEITIGPRQVDLSTFWYISVRPGSGDGPDSWLVTFNASPNDPRGEPENLGAEDAKVLLRELRLRARTKPKRQDAPA
jgi:hypothetical protein